MENKKSIFAWAMYDWANSAYATVVLAGFFPLFFKQYWSAEYDATTSTFQLGVANSLASLTVVLLAPVLGAIADAGAKRKVFLFSFAVLGILTTAGLFAVEKNVWWLAALLFVMATIGFSGANVFYDALIKAVAPANRLDSVSALGYALGYLGGGLLMAFNVVMFQKPEWFGFADASVAVRTGFIAVAVWWAIFSIPLLLFVREPAAYGLPARGIRMVTAGFQQLRATFLHIRQYRQIGIFLIAYWLYIDAVDTIVRMAVDYGMALGFDAGELITALLITQFVGFPAAIAFGWLGERIGTRRGIFLGLAVYIMVTVMSYWMNNVREFYILAVVIGLVQGGVQSLSRSFYARMVPLGREAEFFGFYNMLGKFAAVIGPLLMGMVALLTGSTRLSILSILVLFIAGAVLLAFVRVDNDAGPVRS
jgi:UMF1 family MFS transporter